MAYFSPKQYILDLLLPRECLGCGAEGSFLCKVCSESMRFVPPSCFVCRSLVPQKGRILPGRTCIQCRKKTHIYAFFAPLLYDTELVREVIHALKYRRIKALAEPLGAMLFRYTGRFGITFPENALFVPIPLHSSRLRTRGFNQAGLIAGEFLKHCGSTNELSEEILRRTKNTAPQVDLSGSQRQKNMEGVFSAVNTEVIKDKDIVLFDDVKTTGATIEEAARVLKEAGAARIWAVTVAH